MCAWELLALSRRTSVPTISQTVHKLPPFGWLLLVLLTHHWFVEAVEAVVLEVVAEVEQS